MIRHEKKASCVLVKHHLNFFSPWGILSINFASKPPAKHLWVPETEMLLGSNPRETLPGSFWVTWLSWNGWSLRWLSTVSTVTWTHNTNTDFAKHSTTNSTCHIYMMCIQRYIYIYKSHLNVCLKQFFLNFLQLNLCQIQPPPRCGRTNCWALNRIQRGGTDIPTMFQVEKVLKQKSRGHDLLSAQRMQYFQGKPEYLSKIIIHLHQVWFPLKNGSHFITLEKIPPTSASYQKKIL